MSCDARVTQQWHCGFIASAKCVEGFLRWAALLRWGHCSPTIDAFHVGRSPGWAVTSTDERLEKKSPTQTQWRHWKRAEQSRARTAGTRQRAALLGQTWTDRENHICHQYNAGQMYKSMAAACWRRAHMQVVKWSGEVVCCANVPHRSSYSQR